MSTITPLGDSSYFDLGHTVLNGFGMELRIREDVWGGDIHNHIPDPPFTFAWPDSWGEPGQLSQSFLAQLGEDSHRVAELPEPATFCLVLVCLIVAIVVKKFTYRQTGT